MGETKLTVERCESWARMHADGAATTVPSIADSHREQEAMARLAARALRLEAWLENAASDGSHVEVETVLSILRGEVT